MSASSGSHALALRDVRLLFAARVARMFGYGLVSVVLVLYLASAGLGAASIGALLTLSLLGDTAVSLWITTTADRVGRKRMLILGAVLVSVAGVGFASTREFGWLLLAATIGVISPSGNEVGPFLAIEQSALAQVVEDRTRTSVFAWYALIGSFATAAGALAGGALAGALQGAGWPEYDSYRTVVVLYATVGAVLAAIFTALSPGVEVRRAAHAIDPPHDDRDVTDSASAASRRRNGRSATHGGTSAHGLAPRPWLGLRRSRKVVLELSALFGLDAFAGGFIVQSVLAYWFHVRFGLAPATLGAIFFWANVLAGLSALAAARIAARFGLVRTMVFTHLPSNVMLLFVPLMPSAASAVALLLVRFCISQMDVPTRQSYTMAVVTPEERSAAAGVTGVARTIGASLSPWLAALCVAQPALTSVPFFLAGALKIVYDLLLYRRFVSVQAPEEAARACSSGDRG